jgi:membrane protein
MAGIYGLFKATSNYFNQKIWKIRLEKVEGRKYTIIKQLRVFTLSVKGFNDDKCFLKATALTYYTLFSVVPIIALAFAIAKGFGFEENLQAQIMDKFSGYNTAINEAFIYANELLNKSRGGIIAGFGVFLLLFSVIRLLSNIEVSFNEIWEIKKGRTWIRKFTDYLSIVLIAPLLVILSGSITVVMQTHLKDLILYVGMDGASPFLLKVFMKLMSMLMLFAMFTFIYMVLPNTKVKFESAAKAAVISAILFEIIQWVYLAFQIGVANYNAIYGSFAAIPLFLIWVQTSWFIVLFGAELAFAYQNVEHYELEHEIEHISTRYKRIISILIAHTVMKNFVDGKKAMTVADLAHKLDIPVRMARNITNEFIQLNIFNEVKTGTDSRESAFQPALSENKLTIKMLLESLDKNGVNEMPVHFSPELEKIHKVMDGFDHMLEESKANILVKDIA